MVAHGDAQPALEHVLKQTDSLQTDRFSAGIGAGDDEDALALGQCDVEWYDFLALFGQ